MKWCGVVGELFIDRDKMNEFGVVRGKENTPVRGRTLSKSLPKTILKGRSKSGVEISQASTTTSTTRTRARSRTQTQTQEREEASLKTVSQRGTIRTTTKTTTKVTTTTTSTTSSSPANGNGIGLFTAALGTGLALGLSPRTSAAEGRQSLEIFPPPMSPTSSTSGHGSTSHTRTKDKAREKSLGSQTASGTLTRTFSAWKKTGSFWTSSASLPAGSMMMLTSPEKKRKGKKGKEVKPPTVRELAIQPTQRVMRYVLQYRDLLQHTPMSSPSKALVERALESATKIAQKCDRAQGNSAFLLRN